MYAKPLLGIAGAFLGKTKMAFMTKASLVLVGIKSDAPPASS